MKEPLTKKSLEEMMKHVERVLTLRFAAIVAASVLFFGLILR